MKTVTIRLTQNDDGTFTVVGFGNTGQLSIGSIVKRERLEFWSTLSWVRYNVIGATPVDDAADQTLMGGLERPQAIMASDPDDTVLESVGNPF
jgi:hypothetical protein